MILESLSGPVMQQALEKGFGIIPEDISVSEKMILIHSELSEAFDAKVQGNIEGKDGFYEEVGDILQRVLHLGGVFKVDFSVPIPITLPEDSLNHLHSLTSKTWEHYRKNNLDNFKSSLVHLAYATLELSNIHNFSIKDSINKKIEWNKGRVWERLNEKLQNPNL